MKNWINRLGIGLFLVICPIIVAAQEAEAANASNVSPESRSMKDMNLKVGLVPLDANYTIGIGDVLTIDVWKQPEVSRTLPVRTDGKISLPLVNDVQAAGLTPTQLGAQISEGLRRVMVNPQV